MMKRMCFFLFSALIGIFLMSGGLFAQVGTQGVILGTVTDPSGAVVPDAQVTVQNLNTGLTTTVKTTSIGGFDVPALPIGSYSVQVSVQGFKTWKVDRVDLTVGARQRLTITLQVGNTSQQVSVTAAPEMLQTETAQTGTTVQEKNILNLPLNGRNVVNLVTLAPGMRFTASNSGPERGTYVQGLGSQGDQTQFSLNGTNVNSGMDEGAITLPDVDSIAEFRVETSGFGAEHGRDPIQVVMVTKSGTNQYHGAAWEFLRNNAIDARNTFSKKTPKLSQNQFGGAAGGPIIKDKTFFFASFEGTTIRQESLYNSAVPDPAWLNGDFSSVSTPIIDPSTGQQFSGNIIPSGSIDYGANFLKKYFLTPTSGYSDGNFHAVAPVTSNTWNGLLRIDQEITPKQRIYGQFIDRVNPTTSPQYSPSVVQTNETDQHNFGLTYNYTITPNTLFTLSASYVSSNNTFSGGSAALGNENLTEEAGIQGFPTPGRSQWVGLPTVNVTGISGFAEPWGTPGRLWANSLDGTASLNLIRGKHSIIAGYSFDNRTTFGRHGSGFSRGQFDFNGQYTGFAFADYLLGLPADGYRNYPLQTFGMKDSPYHAIFAQDYWNVSRKVTLQLGLRWDYWAGKEYVCGNGATFDPSIGKIVAGLDNQGKVNLTCQPVAQYLAPATAGEWVSAKDIGVPKGLFEPNGYFSPRVGIAWRVSNGLVVRGNYGLFASSFAGNRTASSIVGPPYWTWENIGFSPSTPQPWETIFPNDPSFFVAPGTTAAAYDIKSQKTHEWNVSVQKELPFSSSLTLTYLGTHRSDPMAAYSYNAVPPGQYTDLQAALPYPTLGSINLYQNGGSTWYNGLTAMWERRFSDGLGFVVSYAYSKSMLDGTAEDTVGSVQPFTPAGYLRGRSAYDRTHIASISGVYDLPFGRRRKYMSSSNAVMDGVIGGWEFTSIVAYQSGDPLSFYVPGATLGNGYGTRADLVGDPQIGNPSPQQWFNPAAFAAPPNYTYGNSGIGIMNGPGYFDLDTGLMKNFNFTESKYLQFRWEMFNALNHVNYNDPQTTINLGSTGEIFSAGPARIMQFALKLYF
jgi:Carboxypeptidase regulatory-like domain/TonB dependent receptor-like, beta-barrel